MSSHPIALVVGGAGYIGSHACKALAAAGFLPVVYDNLSTGHQDLVRWGPFIEGNLLDADTLAEAFAEHRPAVVLHFAACAYVGESFEDPAKYYANNVIGALHLLDAARSADNAPIVFSSSCAVYGEPASVPITEGAALAPVNPYGRTKLAVEHALADYEAAYGLRSVRLRYFKEKRMRKYLQYGCGWSAPKGWRNFDASPTLRFERLPLIGRLYTRNGQRFPENVEYGDIVKGLPVAAQSFHGVYCSHVLEHLSLADFRTALINTWRILKTGERGGGGGYSASSCRTWSIL